MLFCSSRAPHSKRVGAFSFLQGEYMDGLIGLFGHRWRIEGDAKELELQGRVVGIQGDTALVECFSWLDGSPVSVRPDPVAEMLDREHWTLFTTVEMMKEAYESRAHK